jgi:hypothetical protein
MSDSLYSPHPSADAAPSHVPSDAGFADAGEPQGSSDRRPSMLGKRFRATLVAGSAIGVVLALAAHYLITQTVEDSTKYNSWSWAFAAIGGFAVGGASSLFIYGAATDRSDTDSMMLRGRADVSERGEWRRTVDRRRRRGRRTDTTEGGEPSLVAEPRADE